MRQTPQSQAKHTSVVRKLSLTSVLAVLVTSLVVGSGFLYIHQANSVATAGLTIREMEQHIADLKRETVELELKAEEVRSLTTIEQASEKLNLVVSTPAEYLPSVPSAVAFGQ